MRPQLTSPRRLTVFPLVSFLLGALLSGQALSQAAAPASAKGATTKALGEINLAGEIDDLAGRQLRARLVTIEPGGHVAAHSHKGRPTMEYVVQGNVIEIRNGIEIAHGPGDVVAANHEVSHWWENRGSVPVVLLPVDVFKPESPK